ncbi:hypothetical protein SAMN05216360_12533 [Methylobacterium phyllostachyos]|uniref:Uncharacterized protein n=1 Tax=Methylobacterium phyllostachyos TaxID=582672 RepID=A0A1H0K7S9_9HYPH|nr:hypothetical protein [Methylobacterium phyllostachyos]SDO51954.1 hypothetical protein SAMN05216360_12533 [Methylobacterium phyllostachyos]
MPGRAPRPFVFAGATYRAPRLCAWDQFAALGLVDISLEDLREYASRGRRRGAMPPDVPSLLRSAIDALGPDKLAELFDLMLAGAERLDDGAWVPVWDPEAADTTFPDLGAARTAALVMQMLIASLGRYFSHRPFRFEPSTDGITYEALQLPNGYSWLLRPVERNMCLFESLLNGAIDLADIALMNDAISVAAENQSRAQAALDAHLKMNAGV